ncbi:MAG: hypothetical protein GOV01_00935 [Candidatus Altiarchaeota archaeon]|nr:hypothetical protein [Candidatus Altiarchaeota archaeon]
MRNLILVILITSMLHLPALAQTASDEDIEIMGFNLNEIVDPMIAGLKGIGLVPDLKRTCEDPDNCNVVELDETKNFFIILIMLWLIFNIAIGLADMPSAIFAFFATSFAFNHFPSLFVTGVTMGAAAIGDVPESIGLFKYVFSALFVFVWVDYIMKYFWAISRTTKLFLNASITLIALFFMDVTNLFTMIEGWLSIFVTGIGFILFIAFMFAMKFFNTFFNIMNVKASRNIREGGREKVLRAEKDVSREVQAAGGKK